MAVLGCGPVGLLAVLAARARGAAAVLAVDGVASRCERAASLGATAFDLDTAPAAVRTLTEGRGADVVLELVGSAAALRLGFELLRPGGVLSSIGVHTDSAFPFSPTDGYNKNLTCGPACIARHPALCIARCSLHLSLACAARMCGACGL